MFKCGGHFGYYTIPGRWNHNKLYVSPEMSSPLIQELLRLLKPLLLEIGRWVEKYFPEEAEKLKQIPEKYRPYYLFSLMTINLTCGDIFHVDNRDSGPCVVVPVGHFTKGGLGFSGFEGGTVALNLNVGDFAVFYGNKLYHQVTEYQGDRMSLVFCTKQKTFENCMRVERGEDVVQVKKEK